MAMPDVHARRHQLRVLATSDVHMNLLGHDYYSDTTHPGLGLSRTARLIEAARTEIAAQGGLSLLLDNGDWMQGTPLGDVALDTPDEPHPAMIAFEHLKYDAIGLGNHEFNYGLEALTQVLRKAHCPVVCSNLTVLDPEVILPIKRSLMISRSVPNAAPDLPPVQIGLFSVLPPQTMIWDADLLRDRVTITDMVECARAQVTELRAAGADIVIALAHTGIGPHTARHGMENALIPIAAIEGLDAAIGGHTHLMYPPRTPAAAQDPAFDIPVVVPGPSGTHLGQIDFDLTYEGGAWHALPRQTMLREIGARQFSDHRISVTEDTRMTAKLAPIHARTRAAMNVSVGHTDVPLHSYFSFIGEDRALSLTAQAQAAAVRAPLQSTPYAGLPVLSALSPAKFGGRAGPRHYTDVPIGPLNRRHVADLCFFPNELRCAVVTGQQLRDWLEMSACVFNQLRPAARAQTLIDPQRVCHNFDVIYGVEYEIDLTQPAQFDLYGQHQHSGPGRIKTLRWRGRPIEPDQQFAVAVNSYRVAGGGNFRMIVGAPQVPLPSLRVRDALEAYVAGDRVDPLADAPMPWRFAPDLGVEVTTVTGPGAIRYLSDLPPHASPSSTIRSDGFVELRLSL